MGAVVAVVLLISSGQRTGSRIFAFQSSTCAFNAWWFRAVLLSSVSSIHRRADPRSTASYRPFDGNSTISTVSTARQLTPPISDADGKFLRPLLFLVIFLSVFICPMNVAKSDVPMEVGLDWQVLLKLGISGLSAMIAAWGFLTTATVRRLLTTIPAAILILILLLAFPSALSGFSDSALPATVINLCYIVFIATSLVYLKEKSFFYALVLGTLTACIFAWTLYFLFPDYGVFKENLGSVTVERLGGHSHPNSVGRTAAIGLLAATALWRDRRISTPISLGLILLFALTIGFTISRTVIVGTLLALAMLFLDRLKTRAGVQWMLLLSFGGLLMIFLLIATGNEGSTISKLAGSVSKTGDTTELTTGTGRVEIWAESIRLISEKPLTGYGFGAAQELLLDYSQSTHNMFIHAAMVAGVFGAGLMVCLAIWLLNVSINSDFRPISALAIFVLVSGIFEDTVLETFPGPATLSFFVACLCPLRRYYHPDENDSSFVDPSHDSISESESSAVESSAGNDPGSDDYERPKQPR